VAARSTPAWHSGVWAFAAECAAAATASVRITYAARRLSV
jgi:hypothetical protein